MFQFACSLTENWDLNTLFWRFIQTKKVTWTQFFRNFSQYRKYSGKDLIEYLVTAVTPYRYMHISTMAHDGKNLFISSLNAGHSYLLVFQHCPSSSITSFFCHLALQKNSLTYPTLNLEFLNRADQQCTIVLLLIFPTGNSTMQYLMTTMTTVILANDSHICHFLFPFFPFSIISLFWSPSILKQTIWCQKKSILYQNTEF